MTRDSTFPRVIGVVFVALVGVTLLASISAPAVQATNSSVSGGNADAAVATDMPSLAQQSSAADCTRCHAGTKGSGINPKLCGECHTEAYEAWNDSGHAESLSEGESQARIKNEQRCLECHEESAIKNRDDIDFQTKQQDMVGGDEPVTCEACHAPPSVGWFGHFGKGGDSIAPSGTGPHGQGDAQVTSSEEVCSACHSNDVVLKLAAEGEINPHSAGLVSADGGTDGETTTPTTPTTTTETPTESQTPGFGPVVALVAVLVAAFVVARRW